MIILLLLFILWSTSAFAATRTQLATDDFNRASIGTNWSGTNQWDCGATTGIIIDSSIRFRGSHSGGGGCSARWVGPGTFTNDHYSKQRLVGVPGSEKTGAICRSSTDVDTTGNNARDHYEYAYQPPNTILRKVVDGVQTTLTTTAAITWANNDTIEIECEGTTIRGFRNGIEQTNAVDATLATGQPGVVHGAVQYGDDWEAGSLSASPPGGTARVRKGPTQQ